MAGKSPDIRSYTVHIYGSGQPCVFGFMSVSGLIGTHSRFPAGNSVPTFYTTRTLHTLKHTHTHSHTHTHTCRGDGALHGSHSVFGFISVPGLIGTHSCLLAGNSVPTFYTTRTLHTLTHTHTHTHTCRGDGTLHGAHGVFGHILRGGNRRIQAGQAPACGGKWFLLCAS